MNTFLHLEPWCQPGPDCYFVSVVGDDSNFFPIVDTLVVVVCFVISVRLATEELRERSCKLCNFDSCREYYRYWTSYYGLPVAGWNAGDDGKDYHNHEA